MAKSCPLSYPVVRDFDVLRDLAFSVFPGSKTAVIYQFGLQESPQTATLSQAANRFRNAVGDERGQSGVASLRFDVLRKTVLDMLGNADFKKEVGDCSTAVVSVPRERN